MDITIEKTDRAVKVLSDNRNVAHYYPDLVKAIESIPFDVILCAEPAEDTEGFFLVDIMKAGISLVECSDCDRQWELKQFYMKYLEKSDAFMLLDETLMLSRNKVYLKEGQQAPKGVAEQVTPRGKRFYYASPYATSPEKIQERTMDSLDEEAEADKKLPTPWYEKLGVKMIHPYPGEVHYSKDKDTFTMQSIGNGFVIQHNGKMLGRVDKERDGEEFIKRRFELRSKK